MPEDPPGQAPMPPMLQGPHPCQTRDIPDEDQLPISYVSHRHRVTPNGEERESARLRASTCRGRIGDRYVE